MLFSLEFWQVSYFGKAAVPQHVSARLHIYWLSVGEVSFAVFGTICPNLVKLQRLLEKFQITCLQEEIHRIFTSQFPRDCLY